MIRSAIISVFDKTGLEELSQFLLKRDVVIYSTGGTFRYILENCLDEKYISKIREISHLTGFPEILGGRVKTLHPMVYGGILAKRDNDIHTEEILKHNIPQVDLVVTNLYNFQETRDNTNNEDEILEKIDIGGVSLIRASAKNFKDVTVLTDPNDYQTFMQNFKNNDPNFRRILAGKAYQYVAQYDMDISSYFNTDIMYNTHQKQFNLKYGINPQQSFAAIYKNVHQDEIPFKIINGVPGYINLLDCVYSWNLVNEVVSSLGNTICCASFKHNSPAGTGISYNKEELSDILKQIYFVGEKQLTKCARAFIKARNSDPMCSYGDFLAFSHEVDKCTAELIATEVSDGIVAPSYDEEALKILKKKRGGSYLIVEGVHDGSHLQTEIRQMHGLTFVQTANNVVTDNNSFNNIVTDNKYLAPRTRDDLILANITLKYTQSNSVCSCIDGQVIGIGAGQQSRIDCVKLVKRKTQNWFLKQHPKCLNLLKNFKKGVRKTDKINSLVSYIDGNIFKNSEQLDTFLEQFEDNYKHKIEELFDDEKENFIKSMKNISLASDAFFPFSDNIDVSQSFGVTNILQPGGSIADDKVIESCNKYKMIMCFTGPKSRMFLH